MNKNRPKYKQIIEAAVEVIAENGYHASQVSKIAKKAGVADGTIYLYFKNKEDILISVFEEKMGQFINQITVSIQDKQDANKKLLELIQMHFTQLAENPQLAVVTQLELRQSNPELRLEINKVLKPYLTVIDSIIEEGMKEGVFRNSLNIPLVRQMIFGTLDETVTNWVMKERKYDLVKQAYEVHALLTEGLANS
ncbi:MAG: TetR/AcrR family transcriptional regulator [Bacillota bacterium]|uniref:TetR/AcrR family transcriptional regulator n=1 Tax=Virgibacillus salarius TaxID=447199 RepID=A0A941IE68_9BACI|nr:MULTISPECIES: TetR/AcrR family transcriptional regulator [Bacillaceae]NAZ10515.1 TetR family transcriptional regulator [Agaribacter marinus]MBR7797805.1 TetR/AcrR family transcriptional regulator [Virgibacillus salarius]MCC2250347.1 TetR family transcriptional regulator [Virgibacillus sp. AGTR]MDY7044092.1 TetR/AcrR family transcriptional regulator [Virgibacillus sp. M23]QRZ17636.1 TetR/AcrR family transcriptional regulator [Virgibacillus sp. AGTR]